MPKYLIRRTNRFGKWEHVATWEYPPDVGAVAQRYGPGEYHILVAEEKTRCLRSYLSFVVPFNIEFAELFTEEPNIEYIKSQHGPGNYFIIGQAKKITPLTVRSEYEQDAQRNGMVNDLMTRGIPAMRNVYVLVRMTGLPYEYYG